MGSETTQLALDDFNFELIAKVSNLTDRNTVFLADLEGHGTGNLSILCGSLNFGDQFFFFHLLSPYPLFFISVENKRMPRIGTFLSAAMQPGEWIL
jgi:hypothetical protein